MTTSVIIPADASPAQLNMIIGALYLSLGRCMSHIARTESPQEADKFKQDLAAALKSGEIDMAIFDDAATYDFVVAMIEGLTSGIETQSDTAVN